MILTLLFFVLLMTLYITDAKGEVKTKKNVLLAALRIVISILFILFISCLLALVFSLVFGKYLPQTELRSITRFPVTEIKTDQQQMRYTCKPIQSDGNTDVMDLTFFPTEVKVTDEDEEYIEVYQSDLKYSWMNWLFIGGSMLKDKAVILNVHDSTLHRLQAESA